ncbi:MAG: hypothetical protein AAGE37_07430 [Pseudomonadota bacterium]
MISVMMAALLAGSSAAAAQSDEGTECKMIPQADGSGSTELCANTEQWESIRAQAGGDIANLRCLFVDREGSSEPVRICGTQEKLQKQMGMDGAKDLSNISCRSVYEVGSRIPVRVCRTEKQWKEISRENEREVANDLRNRTGN